MNILGRQKPVSEPTNKNNLLFVITCFESNLCQEQEKKEGNVMKKEVILWNTCTRNKKCSVNKESQNWITRWVFAKMLYIKSRHEKILLFLLRCFPEFLIYACRSTFATSKWIHRKGNAPNDKDLSQLLVERHKDTKLALDAYFLHLP